MKFKIDYRWDNVGDHQERYEHLDLLKRLKAVLLIQNCGEVIPVFRTVHIFWTLTVK